jgi:hypothetical protein
MADSSDPNDETTRALQRGLAEVQTAQAQLLSLVDELLREPDQARQNELVRRIAQRSEALRELSERLEAQAREVSREVRGFVEVELTREQQRIVEERTGAKLTSVMVPDDTGGIVRAMPTMPREQILDHALEEGERRAREGRARRAAREELDRIREELRNAPEQVRRELERLLDDPEFKRAFDGAE